MKKSATVAKTFFMKKQLIQELFEKFEQARYIYEGIECWSARELQDLFNYSEWRNFVKVIDKAKEACSNVGERVEDHVIWLRRMEIRSKMRLHLRRHISLYKRESRRSSSKDCSILRGLQPGISFPNQKRSCPELFISAV